MHEDQFQRVFNVPQRQPVWYYILAAIGLQFVYPLAVLPIYYLVTSGSFFTCILLFVLMIIVYKLLSMIAAQIKSIFTLRSFSRQFLGDASEYELSPIKLDASLTDELDFGYLKVKAMIAEKVGMKGEDRASIDNPIRTFYVKKKSDAPVTFSKAFVALTGLVLLLVRVPSTSNLPLFEKFLVLHELEHVSARGFRNDQTLVAAQMFLALHAGIGIWYVDKPYEYGLVVAFLLIVGLQRFGVMPAAREALADNVALRKLQDYDHALEVIRLLKRTFLETQKSGGNFKDRYTAKSRLEHALYYEKLLEAAKDKNLEFDEIWFQPRTDYQINSMQVAIGASCLLWVYLTSVVPIGALLTCYLYLLVVSVVTTPILVAFSRGCYLDIHRKMPAKYLPMSDQAG